MRGKDLEDRLAQAVTRATPDVLERVLSSCEQQKGDMISMTTTKKRKYYIPLTIVAALLVVCVGIFGLVQWQSGGGSNSVVLLDVNPSISLTVSAREKVLSAEGLNEDGQQVLSDLELEGVDLTTAVSAIVGSMLQKGYLSDLQNAILVSVENDDAATAAQLEALVSEAISSAFSSSEVESAVLTQTVTEDETVTQLAETYGISAGKAALILALIQQDETLTAENLAALTINDLTLLCQSRGISVDSLSQTGQASTLAYIGEDAALEIACGDAGVAQSELNWYTVKFDSEDGVIVYDVEFSVGDTSGSYVEYEYEINAQTGAIVSYGRESRGSSAASANQTTIDATAAQEAALAHAGLTASQV
ncbi:MAG: PepSY domain-containing protein, partial [Oscillospiraceae bacterium]|nr:PepSY domain-containing protein [Oscillospiraceae bacterium]